MPVQTLFLPTQTAMSWLIRLFGALDVLSGTEDTTKASHAHTVDLASVLQCVKYRCVCVCAFVIIP